jgi:hypothetical protein
MYGMLEGMLFIALHDGVHRWEGGLLGMLRWRFVHIGVNIGRRGMVDPKGFSGSDWRGITDWCLRGVVCGYLSFGLRGGGCAFDWGSGTGTSVLRMAVFVALFAEGFRAGAMGVGVAGSVLTDEAVVHSSFVFELERLRTISDVSREYFCVGCLSFRDFAKFDSE